MEAIGDKYSFYKNAEGGEQVEDSLTGNTTGIGVTVYNDYNNKAHNCGHDFHTTSLLGCIKILCQNADKLTNNVVFIFST